MTQTQNKINERLSEIKFDLDLDYYYQSDQTFDEYIECVTEAIYQEEIIYYSKAIEYLEKNDPSLSDSVGIANDMGYNLKNINSELLATLHYQQYLHEELYELRDKIEEIFNEAN